MKAAHFQTPPCSSQSSSTINNPSPHPSPFLVTPESWLSCLCPPSAPPGSPVYRQNKVLCVHPPAKGKQESRTGAYPHAGSVAEAHPHRPRISHRRWHSPFCQCFIRAEWHIIGVRPRGATFLLQIPSPVTRGCLQVTEQAAKACYCSVLPSSLSILLRHRQRDGVCWLLSSHQQLHIPLLRGSSGPKRDGLIMTTVKFRERPEARLKNWKEGNISGKGQQERLQEWGWQ